MKINLYKSLLLFLPWLTFIFGVFHLIGDLSRQSGSGQLWNIGLFIALLSQQYCQRKGAFKFHFLLSNYNINLRKYLFLVFLKTPNEENMKINS